MAVQGEKAMEAVKRLSKLQQELAALQVGALLDPSENPSGVHSWRSHSHFLRVLAPQHLDPWPAQATAGVQVARQRHGLYGARPVPLDLCMLRKITLHGYFWHKSAVTYRYIVYLRTR